MTFLFRPHQRIAFLGDERFSTSRPDDVAGQILGRIQKRYPNHRLSSTNRCAPGLTVERALEIGDFEVDWVVVGLGMHDGLRSLELGEFQRTYRALVARFGVRTVICEPCALEPAQIAQLEPYRASLAAIARELGAPFVPFQRSLDRVLPGTTPSDWGAGFHLNAAGSTLLTEEFLGAIGFEVFEDDDAFLSEPAPEVST